jgi:hypothetical protein
MLHSDLKGITKVVNAILILRKGGSTDWTTDLDAAMISWSREYINWLETAPLALGEGNSAKYVSYLIHLCSRYSILTNAFPATTVPSTTTNWPH